MTATAGSSAGAAPSQAANGNAPSRATNSSTSSPRPGHGPRHAIDFFSNLLGLMGADNNTLNVPGVGAIATKQIPDDALALDALGNPVTHGSANPLADLIGWAGSPSAMGTASSLSASDGSAMGTGTGVRAGAPLSAGTTAPSPAANGMGGQGDALQGMTVLKQPVEADAGLLAQLKSGALNQGAERAMPDSANTTIHLTAEAQAAQPTSAVRTNTLVASRPANWRSTTTLGPASALPNAPASLPTSTTAIQQTQNLTPQPGRDISANLSARNTVAQAERFNASIATEAGVSGTALAIGAQARSSQNDQQPSGRGDAGLLGAPLTDAQGVDAPEQAFSLDNALTPEDPTDPNEQLGMHQLRHASVRIGEGTDEAIDIRLALEGDAVNVNFRTDNAEVRAGLQNNAGQSLADLLQRSGLQLSGVSVDGQSPNAGGQPGHPSHSGQGSGGGSATRQGADDQRAGGASRDRDTTSATAQRAPVTRRADGGPALDVFA
ncbi:MAG: flagellar hook-length control protein FliK [Hydrogenophaga sp.]